MTKKDALQFIISFLRAESPFEEIKEYGGHAGSMIPDIFVAWFERQSDADRRVICETLLEFVIDYEQSAEDLGQVSILLLRIVRRYPSFFSEASVNKVEQLCLQQDNLNNWLNDIDGNDDQKDFRSTWRFALPLWIFLRNVNSPAAKEMYQVLSEVAKDAFFAQKMKQIMNGSGGRLI